MTFLWSVFTKPWSRLPGEELGRLVAGLGFSGAEVPVRDTAFVTPAAAERLLPAFAARLRAEGVEVISVASDLGPDGYAASVRRVRQRLEAAAPLAERYGVRIGVQPNHGRFVSSALGVMDLLDGLPPAHFQVVWDAAHDAPAGDDPRVTLPLVAGRLGIVNLKNAVYAAAGGVWKPWFVPAREGTSDWSAVLGRLSELGWTGPVCLSGQYSDPSVPVEERLVADLAAARSALRGK